MYCKYYVHSTDTAMYQKQHKLKTNVDPLHKTLIIKKTPNISLICSRQMHESQTQKSKEILMAWCCLNFKQRLFIWFGLNTNLYL